jgi:hypothetical protein
VSLTDVRVRFPPRLLGLIQPVQRTLRRKEPQLDNGDKKRHNIYARIETTALEGENSMQPTSDIIFQEALMLPENERLTLVLRLLETMPADDSSTSLDDAALVEELERRFADREGCAAWSDLRAEK